VYAGSADGNAPPTRVIQGVKTLQARTSHYIHVDSENDELAVPNPFAQALLFFNGGANGDEAPIRVIQGPKTMLHQPDNVAVDSVHNEVYTAQFTNDAILVFRRDVGGDVAPIRILHGPRTQLDRPIRVEVDPINNVIAVTADHALLIFDRSAEGDTPPKWVISGPKTGVGTSFGTRDVKLYPDGKKIIATARTGGGRGFGGGGQRFLGVWNYGDTGDIAPWLALNDTPTSNLPGSRLAINPKNGEMIIGGDGQVSVYRVPEIFQRSN
jgi:DNA-binding beta-propeller fold protein YncE